MGIPARARGLLVDAATVAVLLALTLLVNWTSLTEAPPETKAAIMTPKGGHHELVTLWWVATALGVAALLLRSTLPLLALVGTSAMAWLHLHGSFLPVTPIDLGLPIALYTVAAQATRRWVSLAALAASMTVMLPLDPVTGRVFAKWTILLTPVVLLPLAWVAGESIRNRRADLAEVEQRARNLERERDQQAQLAAAAERARIARELHDVVAHGLSVIVIQAQAAAGAVRSRPERAEQALAAIIGTGRTALAEMRPLLGLDQADRQRPELAPLPGLADLPALVERVRVAGLPVQATVTGRIEDVPAGIGLSAYRIAQEALTNVLKHAGPAATATASVQCREGVVEVSVEDTGVGPPTDLDDRSGNGLRGMRQRVAMLGGTLSAGGGESGGFRVHANLPWTTS